MRDTLRREVAAAGLTFAPVPGVPVTAADMAGLPEPARRFMDFMGVPGRPRDRAFRARLRGRFRAGLDAPWKSLDSRQYNTAPPDIARLFHMRLPFFGVPVQGRDTYVHGVGSMLVRPLDLFTVQDARGAEFDLGELVTWVNDAVMFAPSMLLHPCTAWNAAGSDAFEVVVTDRGHTVAARVEVRADGAPTGFVTRDRWLAPPGAKAPVRTSWSTPVDGWQACGDRMVPTTARAVWLREEGEFPYAEFTVRCGDVEWDVPPGEV